MVQIANQHQRHLHQWRSCNSFKFVRFVLPTGIKETTPQLPSSHSLF
jgi:hypothetical protein